MIPGRPIVIISEFLAAIEHAILLVDDFLQITHFQRLVSIIAEAPKTDLFGGEVNLHMVILCPFHPADLTGLQTEELELECRIARPSPCVLIAFVVPAQFLDAPGLILELEKSADTDRRDGLFSTIPFRDEWRHRMDGIEQCIDVRFFMGFRQCHQYSPLGFSISR